MQGKQSELNVERKPKRNKVEVLQAKEESESRNVEVPLSPEEPHVHLDLSVQVGAVRVLTRLLFVAVLPHLADGICKQKKLFCYLFYFLNCSKSLHL
jgi:hypothetical protein